MGTPRAGPLYTTARVAQQGFSTRGACLVSGGHADCSPAGPPGIPIKPLCAGRGWEADADFEGRKPSLPQSLGRV